MNILSIYKKYKILIYIITAFMVSIILILCFYNQYNEGFLYPHESLQKYPLLEGQEILVFADRNKLQTSADRYIEISGIHFDKDEAVKYIITKVAYQPLGKERYGFIDSYRQFMTNKENNIASYLNIGKQGHNDFEYFFLWIKYDNRKLHTVTKSIMFNYVSEYMEKGYYDTNGNEIGRLNFTGINSKGTDIITHKGYIIDTVDEMAFDKYQIYKYSSIDSIIIYGSAYVDDSHIIHQAYNYKNIDTDNEIISNMLIMDNNSQNKNIYKTIAVGYNYLHPTSAVFLWTPLSVSPDNRLVAFQAILKENDDQPLWKNGNQSLWLHILNIDNDEHEPIVKLGSDNHPAYYKGKATIIEWSPDEDSNLIALASEKDIRIINIKEKKIIKELPSDTNRKSMRWSPDGKKLGYLNKERTIGYSSKKVITPSSLWIYDLEKDQLTKIAEDPDYFDFLWVNP